MSDPKKGYRSAAWFSKLDKDGFIHRSWVGRGLPPDAFDGRPLIGHLHEFGPLGRGERAGAAVTQIFDQGPVVGAGLLDHGQAPRLVRRQRVENLLL